MKGSLGSCRPVPWVTACPQILSSISRLVLGMGQKMAFISYSDCRS